MSNKYLNIKGVLCVCKMLNNIKQMSRMHLSLLLTARLQRTYYKIDLKYKN